MARFTTAAAVMARLPRNYDTADLPDDDDTVYESLDTQIVKISGAIMSRLGSIYCTFNSADHATLPTPGVINDICTNWVLGIAGTQVLIGDGNDQLGASSTAAITMAHARLDAILDQNVPDSIPLGAVSSETITFPATKTDRGLNTNEAFINVQSQLDSLETPTIIESTVAVLYSGYTDYRTGIDFSIRYAPEHRKWVFVDNGSLHSQTAPITIKYSFDYTRAVSGPKVSTASRSGLLGGF